MQHAHPPRRVSRFRILIGLGFLLLAAALLTYRMTLIPPDHPDRSLSVTEAHQAVSDGRIILIDVRRPDEWRRTGVPDGAVPIDMRRDDFLAALTDIVGPDKSRPVALICARGGRSTRLAHELSKAGFTHIINVPEGMLGSGAGPGWVKSGLPVQAPPQ